MEDLHLFIYGEIGGGFFDEGGISIDNISKELTDSKAENVVIHISSPGGSVFDGWTIGNLIKNSGKKTVAKIEGLCASIATYIALSCERVEMAETARFMIHNPKNGLEGEEDELKEAAEQLAKIKDDLIKTYKDKTGIPTSKLSRMMDEETILTAEEAKDQGFVDAFMTPLKAVAYFKSHKEMIKVEKVDSKETAKVTKMDQIIQQGKDILAKLIGTVKNVSVTLADGVVIFIDSEDGEFEGKAAWTVDEEGNPTDTPVEDGTFSLDDGRSLTVEGGIVTSVQEAEPEEVDVLKAKVKELETEMTAKIEKEKEAEVKAKETEKSVSDLILETENLKKMTAGDKTPLKKPIIEPQNKFDTPPEEGHGLDGFAGYLKRNR